MGVEYPLAIDMFNDNPDYIWPDKLNGIPSSDLIIVNHKTASNGYQSATMIAQFFQNNAERKTAHFVVGRDGSVIQVVRLHNAAGANCCLEAGHNSLWDSLQQKYGNLNFCTISIEHEDWTSDNSQVMTQAQIDASNRLNLWLVQKYNLDTSHIHSHTSLDPISRARCPGPTFDFNQLFDYIDKGGHSTVNPNVAKQASDVWNMNSVQARNGTGIYNAWMKIYESLNPGMPVSQEHDTVNWSGTPIVYQAFSNGIHAEWLDGVCKFYDHNKLVATVQV